MRIGLDFDNTIACYDEAFKECSRILGFVPGHNLSSKQTIKEHILRQPEGEINWQRLQGQVYGKYIYLASLFPGLAEFLWFCRHQNAEVFIVSHKTEFGHFDEEKVNLRKAALEWMEKKNFFSDEHFCIKRENVFFESTRESKIHRIKQLGLDCFVDDLVEVVGDPNFPQLDNTILFQADSACSKNIERAPHVHCISSWRKIAQHIFSDTQENCILAISQAVWKELNLTGIATVRGHGNSRIYQLHSPSRTYALKIYPDLMVDPRQRLANEFKACNALSANDLPVPQSIAKDSGLNWGLYDWIHGEEIDANRLPLISHSIDFLRRLHGMRTQLLSHGFVLASEACLSGLEIDRQIQRRLLRLQEVDSEPLQNFLNEQLVPVYAKAKKRAQQGLGNAFEQELDFSRQTLSPSDFGFHNCKRTDDGRLFFYDFEYFGWDDPVKLVSDSLWHPGMNLNPMEATEWLKFSRSVYSDDGFFDDRFGYYHPLFGVRWCLIVLNEFLKAKLINRLNAVPSNRDNVEGMKASQLAKARSLLERVAAFV